MSRGDHACSSLACVVGVACACGCKGYVCGVGRVGSSGVGTPFSGRTTQLCERRARGGPHLAIGTPGARAGLERPDPLS